MTHIGVHCMLNRKCVYLPTRVNHYAKAPKIPTCWQHIPMIVYWHSFHLRLDSVYAVGSHKYWGAW